LSLRICDVPGICAHCGVFLRLNHLAKFFMAKLLASGPFVSVRTIADELEADELAGWVNTAPLSGQRHEDAS